LTYCFNTLIHYKTHKPDGSISLISQVYLDSLTELTNDHRLLNILAAYENPSIAILSQNYSKNVKQLCVEVLTN